MRSAAAVLKRLYPQQKVQAMAYGDSPLLGTLIPRMCHVHGASKLLQDCEHPDCVVRWVLES